MGASHPTRERSPTPLPVLHPPSGSGANHILRVAPRSRQSSGSTRAPGHLVLLQVRCHRARRSRRATSVFSGVPSFRSTDVALALAGIVVVACTDLGTESFDPMGSSKKAQEAFGRVGSNAAVHNFDALQSAFTFTGASPQAIQPKATAMAPAAPAGVPAGALTRTFIYDSPTGKYVASDQTGAPDNGARFILYEVNPATRAITIPLVPIGHLDLTNESTPSPSSLGVKAVIGSVTVLDYRASGSGIGGGLSVSAQGNVSDGTGRLDFELGQNFSQATGVRIDYKVSAPSPEITIQTVATQTGGATSPTTVTLTVTEGRNKLEVSATGTSASVIGTVEYNGHDIAKISGSGDQPVFTGQGGRQLTAAEMDGLKQLFDFVDVLFEGIDDLLIPAYFAL